jgi:hypothetical protein
MIYFLTVSIPNIILVISLCILERGNKIWYIRIQWNSGRATWYDITSGRVFCNTSICGIESDLDGRFESFSISLHASYRSFQLGWYIVLTRNNSSWVFSEPEKQVCRFTMASRSKSFNILHVVEKEQRGVMDIWCTSGLRRVRRNPSITRGGLNADEWCVRLSMRSPTVYTEKNLREWGNAGMREWGNAGMGECGNIG